jgi:hypothetical protein
MDLLDVDYHRSRNGVVKLHKRLVDKEGEEFWIPISTPIGVTARLRQIDRDDSYALRVVVQDMNGQPRPVDFDRSKLATMNAAEIREELYRAGLCVEKGGDIIAIDILKAANPSHEIAVVTRPGWHWIDGLDDPIFISPAGDVIGSPDDFAVELSVNNPDKGFSRD